MKWIYFNTGENSGQYNMEFDIELAKNCSSDEAYFRLYRWQPYAISLGANQSFESVNIVLASSDGIDVVKRPTGGRAILHAEELTYSVVIPTSLGLTSQDIYSKTSNALVEGLRLYDERLSLAELESVQPLFQQLYQKPEGIACFAASAKSEVKINGKKLIGSAQRKMNSVILQHGSILCGDYHLNIIDYLLQTDVEKEIIKKELSEKTCNIKSFLNEDIDFEKLIMCVKKGFETYWEITFEQLSEINELT